MGSKVNCPFAPGCPTTVELFRQGQVLYVCHARWVLSQSMPLTTASLADTTVAWLLFDVKHEALLDLPIHSLEGSPCQN